MVKIPSLALVAALSVAGCGGLYDAPPLNPDAAGSMRSGGAGSSGAPFGVDQGEVETPNSLPSGMVTRNPIAPETGVVGVRHLPP